MGLELSKRGGVGAKKKKKKRVPICRGNVKRGRERCKLINRVIRGNESEHRGLGTQWGGESADRVSSGLETLKG